MEAKMKTNVKNTYGDVPTYDRINRNRIDQYQEKRHQA
ncbi:hypothetical protein AS4_19040 [Acinetobacter guillouiae]|nr:hypothetical protein AS4_19040 [Acinetobacter guillouiae]